MINGLDLFSGIGGISYALQRYVRPVAYCDIHPAAQANLLSLQSEGRIKRAPICDDVQSLHGRDIPEPIDIIYGGFPCQDISFAGARKGLAGERSNLFYQIIRLVQELRPTFIFIENVFAILSNGGGDVVKAITECGYDCRWQILSAADVGANHERKRFWLLAHANGNGVRVEPGGGCRQSWQSAAEPFDDCENVSNSDRIDGRLERSSACSAAQRSRQESTSRSSGDVPDRALERERSVSTGQGGEGQRAVDSHGSRSEMADTESQRLPRRGNQSRLETKLTESCDDGEYILYTAGEGLQNWFSESFITARQTEKLERPDWWAVEPDLGRVAHGVPFRVDRIKGLGNSVVPQCAIEAFENLIGINFLDRILWQREICI